MPSSVPLLNHCRHPSHLHKLPNRKEMAALMTPAGPYLEINLPSPASLVSALKQRAVDSLPTVTVRASTPSHDTLTTAWNSFRSGMATKPASPSLPTYHAESGVATYASNPDGPRLPIVSKLFSAMGFSSQPSQKDSNLYCGPYGIEVM